MVRVTPGTRVNVVLSARWGSWLAGGILALAVILAYQNSFRAPFLFDDEFAIRTNPTIRELWPLWKAFAPVANSPLGGRPFLHFSFAVNHALGGLSPWGYHAVNLGVHLLAGLTLMGIVRRTLMRPLLAPRFGAVARPLALAVALLWVLHPLQTAAVTYISQRAESMMGLCYLLTLYGLIRGVESARPWRWYALSAGACWLGMGTKEVMVTAPLLVLLYDRVFVAGNLRQAWQSRRGLYLGLAGAWVLVGWSTMDLTARSVGYGLGLQWWEYALTECWAVVQYLRLAFWPQPLVFDYGADNIVIRDVFVALPYALILVGLGAAVVLGRRRWPAVAYAGTWFFLILLPTSSVVPVALSPMAEHRMYLSLAAVAGLAATGVYTLLGRRSWPLLFATAAGLGFLSWERNHDYRSELAIWSDTVEKRPDNVRARCNLGQALLQFERVEEALSHYREAVRLQPDQVGAHSGLGVCLSRLGRTEEALSHYREALRLRPDHADTHNNLGNLLRASGRSAEAIPHLALALELKPGLAETRFNLGLMLVDQGRFAEAIVQFREGLRTYPTDARAHHHLAVALSEQGEFDEALVHYREALRFQPDYAAAHFSLAREWMRRDALVEAAAHYQAGLRLEPDNARAHNNLGVMLARQGRLEEAITHYREALRLQPHNQQAANNLKSALAIQQNFP